MQKLKKLLYDLTKNDHTTPFDLAYKRAEDVANEVILVARKEAAGLVQKIIDALKTNQPAPILVQEEPVKTQEEVTKDDKES